VPHDEFTLGDVVLLLVLSILMWMHGIQMEQQTT